MMFHIVHDQVEELYLYFGYDIRVRLVWYGLGVDNRHVVFILGVKYRTVLLEYSTKKTCFPSAALKYKLAKEVEKNLIVILE